MRPTAHPQSAIRTPLNHVLATEVNVRVLRILSELSSPITAAELARRAQLQRSSVHRGLKVLEDTGVVEFVGPGPRVQVVLRDHNPLVKGLRELFAIERKRFDDLVGGVRKIANALEDPPIAAWIEGPVAQGVDRGNDPVVVGVVDGARTLAETCETVRRAAEPLEKKLDVTVEVRGRTLADLDAMSPREAAALDDAIPLVGVPPAGLLARHQSLPKLRNIRVHADHDTRARLLGVEVADALKRDPSLVQRARAYVDRRWRDASPGERKELDEWRRILRTASPARLRRILTDPGQRSTRLRQTLPFLGVFKDQSDR